MSPESKVNAQQAIASAEELAPVLTARLFEHVLVPVDGSELSSGAVIVAIALAARMGGEIAFCMAVDDAGVIAETAEMPWTDPTPVIDALMERARGFLSDAERLAAAAHVKCTTEVLEGNPVDQIVKLAEERGADSIVMGSHGRSGLERLFLGSTTEGVLRHCGVPVLVIRQAKKADAAATAPGHD